MFEELGKLDMSKNQFLMSIRKKIDGKSKRVGDIEIQDNKILVNIGTEIKECDNFVQMIYFLQNRDISLDNFFF